MGFIKKYNGPRSYDLLSNYNHFMPGITDLIWLILLLFAGAFLGSLLMLATIAWIPIEYGTVIVYPLMFIPAMIYASAKSRRNENFEDGYKLDNNNFGNHKGITMAFIVMVMTVAAAFVVEPINMLLPEMPEDLIQSMEQMMNAPAWLTLISISVFAPFFEEWLCRGIVLRGMLKKFGPAWAIILSSLFFAIIHMNIWQGIPAFLIGLVFGYVYYKTGSLKLTMLMHFTNNTLAYVLGQIPSLQDMEYFKDVLSPWAYWLVFALAAIALICGIMVLKGIPQKEDNLGGCQRIKSIF